MGIGVAFRKKALEAVGGFDERFQVLDFYELSLRWDKHQLGRSIASPDLKVIHLENPKRFSFKGYLERRFQYAYWNHILFHSYPSRVGLSAFPLKTLTFCVLGILSFYYAPFLILLLSLCITWILYKTTIYRRGGASRSQTRYCLSKFQGKFEKIAAFLVLVVLYSLEVPAGDYGKFRGILDSLRGKINLKIG